MQFNEIARVFVLACAVEIGYGPDDHTGLDFVDLSIIGADGRFMR